MNRKTIKMIGMILGAIVIIAGIMIIVNPPHTFSTSSADYASFGGDFYTYEYKATSIAASNAAVAANNLRELSKALSLYHGIILIVGGLVILLHYLDIEVSATPTVVVRDKNNQDCIEDNQDGSLL